MDSMLIWIVMFAGAAIALLAVFLVASEKELKKKRLEIDQLVTKLGDTPDSGGIAEPTAMEPGVNREELEQLRSRNQELEREIAAVSSKLQMGADTNAAHVANANDELELAQRNVEIAKSNAQWLQATNDELKAQVEELKSRLGASEERASESSLVSQGTTDRQFELEREVAALREQLAESRSQSHEINGMEQKLANVDAIENNHRDEVAQFQAQIAELQKGLSAANAARANEVEAIRAQLAESERMQQSLRDERLALEQEMSRSHARVNQAEEQNRRLSALREPFDNLLAKQAALEERQHEYHEAMAGFSQLIANAEDWAPQSAGFNEFHAAPPVGASPHAPAGQGIYDAAPVPVSPTQVIAAAQTADKPKRRFGMFPFVIALALGGTMAALWSMRGSDTTTTANALPVVSQDIAPAASEVAPLPESSSIEQPSEQPLAAPEAPAAAEEIATTAVKVIPQPTRPLKVARVRQTVAGTYEITQSSRVYAAPTELSQTMGEIEPGVRVTVVNAKNGWLEIHSKHGRPPGFIRKESARVLALN